MQNTATYFKRKIERKREINRKKFLWIKKYDNGWNWNIRLDTSRRNL